MRPYNQDMWKNSLGSKGSHRNISFQQYQEKSAMAKKASDLSKDSLESSQHHENSFQQYQKKSSHGQKG
jgi:hypothetical protein